MYLAYNVIDGLYDDEGVASSEVTLRINTAELDRLLAAYDPNVGTSPGVADCRPIVRAILDKIKEVRGV